MKYSLRSLMIVVPVLPPLVAWGWCAYSKWRAERQNVIGVPLSNWGLVRPSRFPLTPEDQAAIDAWFAAQPNSPQLLKEGR